MPKTSVKSVAANAKPKTAAAEKRTARSAASARGSKPAPAKRLAAGHPTRAVGKAAASTNTTESKAKKAAPAATAQTRKAQMPNKQKITAPKMSEEAIAATKAGSAGKTATTRHAAAAFVAARKKMAPATHPARSGDDSAAKGGAEAVDKKLGDRKLKKDNVATTTTAPATAEPPPSLAPAPKPAVVARPPMPGIDKAAVKPKPVAAKAPAFKTGEFIVYPAHGVGEIVAIERQEVAGYKLELFVISFVKDKMILKVPLPKSASVGMRKLAEGAVLKRALDTLTGRARIKRTMWSRRAQEYEAKINSGDIVAIAEVVRDLYRSDAQPEQSYSERQLYEAALDRMARELAVVQKLTDTEALKVIDDQLQKGPRRSKTEEAEDGDETDEAEGGIVEAA